MFRPIDTHLVLLHFDNGSKQPLELLPIVQTWLALEDNLFSLAVEQLNPICSDEIIDLLFYNLFCLIHHLCSALGQLCLEYTDFFH